MTTPRPSRPSRRVAVARLRRLARYLDGLSEAEYDQASVERCALGHARRLFELRCVWELPSYLDLSPWPREIFGHDARVRTPRGKAKQLRALAARLAKEE